MSATNYTYLLVDFFCILFPLAFSFHKKFRFFQEWKAFFPACLITSVFFIAWDIGFTELGVWSFNPRYTLPARMLNLPYEEILFFICIPYASVFMYYCVKKYIRIKAHGKRSKVLYMCLAVLFIITGLLNIPKLYTSVTLILLGLLLFYLCLRNANYLNHFFASWFLVLPFFFLSNGILTGTFIDEPVVMYNPVHYFGLRLFTIPAEDLFYGMLLLLMNVGLYEGIASSAQSK